jgi:hypothetical protein
VTRIFVRVCLIMIFTFGTTQADDGSTPALPGVLILEDFSTSGAGFPTGWRTLNSDDQHTATAIYQVEPDSLFLRAVHDGSHQTSGTQIIKRIDWDIKRYPILRWSWRANNLPPGGSERQGSKTNDCAASVYVIYKIRNLLFAKLPVSIKYTWSTTEPVGTSINGRFASFKIEIAESGADNLGEWVTEEVDVYEDHRRRFGNRPRGKAVGIAILTDADATRSVSAADYGSFYAMTREAAQAMSDSSGKIRGR